MPNLYWLIKSAGNFIPASNNLPEVVDPLDRLGMNNLGSARLIVFAEYSQEVVSVEVHLFGDEFLHFFTRDVVFAKIQFDYQFLSMHLFSLNMTG
jgi:hypothetical protein